MGFYHILLQLQYWELGLAVNEAAWDFKSDFCSYSMQYTKILVTLHDSARYLQCT